MSDKQIPNDRSKQEMVHFFEFLTLQQKAPRQLCVGFLFLSIFFTFNCNAQVGTLEEDVVWYTKRNEFACVTKGDMNDLVTYIKQSDKAAITNKIKKKKCFLIEPNIAVRITERDPRGLIIEIRQYGSAAKVWTFDDAVSRTKTPALKTKKKPGAR